MRADIDRSECKKRVSYFRRSNFVYLIARIVRSAEHAVHVTNQQLRLIIGIPCQLLVGLRGLHRGIINRASIEQHRVYIKIR